MGIRFERTTAGENDRLCRMNHNRPNEVTVSFELFHTFECLQIEHSDEQIVLQHAACHIKESQQRERTEPVTSHCCRAINLPARTGLLHTSIFLINCFEGKITVIKARSRHSLLV